MTAQVGSPDGLVAGLAKVQITKSRPSESILSGEKRGREMRSIAALKLVGIATDLPSRRTRRRAEAAGVHILVAISAATDWGWDRRLSSLKRPGVAEAWKAGTCLVLGRADQIWA